MCCFPDIRPYRTFSLSLQEMKVYSLDRLRTEGERLGYCQVKIGKVSADTTMPPPLCHNFRIYCSISKVGNDHHYHRFFPFDKSGVESHALFDLQLALGGIFCLYHITLSIYSGMWSSCVSLRTSLVCVLVLIKCWLGTSVCARKT